MLHPTGQTFTVHLLTPARNKGTSGLPQVTVINLYCKTTSEKVIKIQQKAGCLDEWHGVTKWELEPLFLIEMRPNKYFCEEE